MMNEQLDLLKYPAVPGYQAGSQTSFEAAEKTKSRMSELHAKILELMRAQARPMHFYEIAELLHEDSRNVQPRLTELFLLDKIKKGPRVHKDAASNISLTGWVLY